MSNQMLTLSEWDKRVFNPPHSQRTLQKWAREGKIYPKPKRIGREYRVQEGAVFVSSEHTGPINVIESKDPIVNDILSGKTQKRRQT
jgi:hypothetical protein